MATRRRKDVVDLTKVGIYACATRCVRRGRFTGYDPAGLNVSHRRTWVRNRLQDLVSVFAIELLDYGILDNSLHALLRIRPDLTPQWRDEDVIRRWHQLNRQQLELNRDPLPRKTLRKLLKQKRRVAEWRKRLSDPSWFMIMLKEPLARAANREDRVSGHFFGERFSCELCETLEDTIQASLFSNMTAVQAGLARRPQDAEFTSFRDRLEDARTEVSQSTGARRQPRQSGWLAPLGTFGDGHDEVAKGRRPTNEGYLPFGLETYAELLDACRCGPRDWGEAVRASEQVGTMDAQVTAARKRAGAVDATTTQESIEADVQTEFTSDAAGGGASDSDWLASGWGGEGGHVLLPMELPEVLGTLGCDSKRWEEAYWRNARRFDYLTRKADELRWDFQRASLGRIRSRVDSPE